VSGRWRGGSRPAAGGLLVRACVRACPETRFLVCRWVWVGKSTCKARPNWAGLVVFPRPRPWPVLPGTQLRLDAALRSQALDS
jgi:hypothetical protein